MAEHPEDPPLRSGGIKRLFLRVTGCVSLALGLLGVVLPLVPATPFILLAAACFAATWPAMHRRLAESRLFGPMLSADRGQRYLPVRTKVGAIVFTLLSIGATIAFAVDALWVRLVLVAIAIGVTGFLLWMPSRPQNAPAAAREGG